MQWGLAYAAGAWVCLQVFEYVGESFGWPSQLRQLAILVALVGVPIAPIIAWYHGDRGRQRVPVTEVVIVALFAGAGALFSVAATSAWLLVRTGLAARNPLTDAQYSTLTDFDGIARAATISRDGKFGAPSCRTATVRGADLVQRWHTPRPIIRPHRGIPSSSPNPGKKPVGKFTWRRLARIAIF